MDALNLLSEEIQPDTVENRLSNTTEEEQPENADTPNIPTPKPEEAQESLPNTTESKSESEPQSDSESEPVSDANGSESEDTPSESSEPEQTPMQDFQEEISALRADVARLQTELQAQTAAFDRMSRECAEFTQLYPHQSISSIPKEVWESVGDGVPLAAAYALHCVKKERREQLAQQVNRLNREASGGDVNGGGNQFLSPGEVRQMSAAQVRENYSKIIDSMKLWS